MDTPWGGYVKLLEGSNPGLKVKLKIEEFEHRFNKGIQYDERVKYFVQYNGIRTKCQIIFLSESEDSLDNLISTYKDSRKRLLPTNLLQTDDSESDNYKAQKVSKTSNKENSSFVSKSTKSSRNKTRNNKSLSQIILNDPVGLKILLKTNENENSLDKNETSEIDKQQSSLSTLTSNLKSTLEEPKNLKKVEEKPSTSNTNTRNNDTFNDERDDSIFNSDDENGSDVDDSNAIQKPSSQSKLTSNLEDRTVEKPASKPTKFKQSQPRLSASEISTNKSLHELKKENRTLSLKNTELKKENIKLKKKNEALKQDLKEEKKLTERLHKRNEELQTEVIDRMKEKSRF